MKRKLLFLVLVVFIVSGIGVLALNFPKAVTTENMQKESVSGGNFVADAIRDAVKADISLVTTSDLRNHTVNASKNVSEAEIVNFISTKNDKIYTISVTGKQILSALEKAVAIYPRNNPAFLQISGFDVFFDPNAKNDSKIISVNINGKPLEKEIFYLIAMSESLSNGAFGYWKIWDTSKAVVNDVTMEDAVRVYGKNKNIEDIYEARIKTKVIEGK